MSIVLPDVRVHRGRSWWHRRPPGATGVRQRPL